MRLLLMILMTFILSCGEKNTTTQNLTNDVPQVRATETAPTEVNPEVNNETSDEYHSEVPEVDIMDVALDVAIEVNGHQITFKQSQFKSEQGPRHNCSLSVQASGAHSYEVSGDSLVIKGPSSEGVLYKRLSGDQGLIGVWVARSENAGQKIQERLTFVNERRVIMRKNCEG
jgi:hypothetical protein